MSHERLQQRLEANRRLNDVYRMRMKALNAGIDTTMFDGEIEKLTVELSRKECNYQ